MREYSNPVETQTATGRLRSGPAVDLVRTANRLEVASAPALHESLSLANLAHVVLLLEAGLVPQADGQRLLAALLETYATPAGEFPYDPAWGDVYKNQERVVSELAPGAGGWLGAGRARRDATNVAYQLAVRWRLLALVGTVEQLAAILVTRAEEHAATLMPDYTYLQQAQPTTLGHYLLGFVYPLLRDLERLRACFERTNRSPGGIGSVNGSRLALDRGRLAELLGFDGVVHHTRDAMWQADQPIEIGAAATALLVNLDRLAEDLQVWATQEFNLVELDDSYTRASVIMPQKKNPYSLAYLRGLTNIVIGQLVGLANVGRTPTGQPDSRIFAHRDVPNLLDQAREAVELMAGVLGTLRVNAELMAQRAGQGYLQATDLAETIMLACRLPYQTAHQIVGQLVATAIERGIPAAQFTPELIDEAAGAVIGHPLRLPAQALAEALDPRAIVATRTGLGGAAPEPMQAMIDECRAALAQTQSWRATTQRRLAAAESALVRLATRLASSAARNDPLFGGLDIEQHPGGIPIAAAYAALGD